MKETVLGIRRKQNSACYERRKDQSGVVVTFVIVGCMVHHCCEVSKPRYLTVTFVLRRTKLVFPPVKAHLQFRENVRRFQGWVLIEFESRINGFKPSLLISSPHVWPGSRYLLEIALLTLTYFQESFFQFLHGFPWRRFGIRLLNLPDNMHPKLLFLETLDHIQIPKMLFPLLKYKTWFW